MSPDRKHIHLILTGKILNPPKNVEEFSNWLTELVNLIDMKILMGPFTVYSDLCGNRGMTGITIIETSHISAHIWDECDPAIIELDVFSCKSFDVNTVIQHMKQFILTHINFKVVDRTEKLKEEKLHIVYETTNLINNKTYIGVHSALSTSDDYLGSGAALKKAIVKYGKENFKKSIIKICNNKEEAFALEKKIVNYEYVNDPTTYNMKEGGRGRILTEETKKKISEKHKNKPKRVWITNDKENILMNESDSVSFLVENANWRLGRTFNAEFLEKLNDGKKGMISHRKGKSLPEHQKLKIKESMLNNFKNGYKVHNKGKKLYIIDGEKVWKDG